MNILFLTDYEDIGNGGDSRVPWEMARYATSKTKNKIYLLTTGKAFSIEKDTQSPLLTILRVPSLKIFSTYRIFISDTFSINTLYELLDSLNLNIVHSHSYSFLSYTVQSWCNNYNKPFIYTSHILPSKALSLTKDNYINKGLNILKIPINIYFHRFYKGCSSIIALNKYAKKDWRKYSKDKYPITIIPNANNLSFHSFNFKSVSPKKKDIQLVFTGRITKTKNQKFLIKSLQYLKTNKNISLMLPGEGISSSELELLSKSIFKNKPIHVEFPGFVSHEKIKEMLQNSTFFLSASLKEVQSLGVIEALASGTPVIALENETTKELIRNNYNGYLLKTDSTQKQFAKAIDKAFNISEDKYIEMCRNSIKSVKHLTWQNVWKKTESLYMKQLNTSRKAPKKNEKDLFKNFSKIFNIKD